MAEADDVQAKIGTIETSYALDAKLCESFICHRHSKESRCPGGLLEDPWGTGEYFLPNKGTQDLDGAKPHGGKIYAVDFDNDGKEDRALWVNDYTHYFDGDYFVIVPNDPQVEAKLLSGSQRGSDVDKSVQWAVSAGLSVYSGYKTPYGADRYTHFRPVIMGSTMLLWTFPDNDKWRPTMLLYKPRPNGALERICEYQRVEE